MPRLLPAAALAALLGLAACESSGTNSSGAGRMLADESRPSGPRAISAFPPETQAFMKAGLHQFAKADPQWPSTRAAWLAKGPEEADFLVQNLWAALLKAQSLGAPDLVERARHELALIGEPSIPLTAAFLAGGTVYSSTDPDTGERRDVTIDDLARREASAVLGLIGPPALPAVRDALEKAASKAGTRYALQTLGNIGDRGGAAAYEPLLAYARGNDDVLRVEAVIALRWFHDDTTRSALIQALGDPDDLVRRKAADSLAVRRDAAAVAYIRAAADRARQAAKLAEAAELDRAAQRIEQGGK